MGRLQELLSELKRYLLVWSDMLSQLLCSAPLSTRASVWHSAPPSPVLSLSMIVYYMIMIITIFMMTFTMLTILTILITMIRPGLSLHACTGSLSPRDRCKAEIITTTNYHCHCFVTLWHPHLVIILITITCSGCKAPDDQLVFPSRVPGLLARNYSPPLLLAPWDYSEKYHFHNVWMGWGQSCKMSQIWQIYLCKKWKVGGKNMGKQAALLNWSLIGNISVTNVNSVYKISHICAGFSIFDLCKKNWHFATLQELALEGKEWPCFPLY